MKPSYNELKDRVAMLENQLATTMNTAESKFSGLYNRTPDAIYILDFSGNFIDANKSALWMLGYNKEELPGLNFFDLIPEEQKRKTISILKDTKKMTGHTRSIEFKVKCSDGSHIWIETKAVTIYRENIPVEIHGIAVDVTERKIREKELHKREEELKLALSGADLGVWYWNIKTGAVSVEKQWGDRVGIPASKKINYENWADWIHPDDRRKAKQCLIDYLDGKTESFQAEHRLKAGDSWIWVVSRGKAVHYDNTGSPLKMAGTYHDITYRVEMQASLETRQKELAEKTLHLKETNTALRVLLKQREKDREELSENIIANINELVNPYLDRIEARDLSERQAAYLSAARSNLKDIVSPFAKAISSPYHNLTPTEIRVADFVKQGRSSKEIAEILCLTKGTVDFHRNNIRTKTGIKNKRTNLRTYLLSQS